jgi:hypothetical protein
MMACIIRGSRLTSVSSQPAVFIRNGGRQPGCTHSGTRAIPWSWPWLTGYSATEVGSRRGQLRIEVVSRRLTDQGQGG